MAQLQFKQATIKALVDVITGGVGMGASLRPIGIYRTASQIDGFMMECNLDFQLGGGSRVPTLTGYLRTLAADEYDKDRYSKLERVILRVAEPDDYADQPDRQQAVIEHLNRFLTHEGYEIRLHHGRPKLVARGQAGAVVSSISTKAATIDFDTVELDIRRALESVRDDPEDAVTAACSIIESVCRSILIELELPLPAKRDVDALVRAVQEPLGLSPGRSDLPLEIAEDIRQVLGGLTSTAKGIGALRTHAGDAHGRERGFRRIDGRIARLAVHGASTLALFLIETWESRQHRPLPVRKEGWHDGRR